MTTKQLSLEHLIKPSNKEGKAPLILLLHGYGSDQHDLFSFASELPDEYIVVSAKAPHQLQPYGNAWYAINFDAQQGKFSDIEQAVESREMIIKFIEELKESYPIDGDQITLLGFSQGTILSFATAFSKPELIKNVIGLSGYIDQNMFDTSNLKKDDLKHLSIYNSHGTQDQVIPVEWARKNKDFFEKYGLDYTYEEYPVGHGVNPQNFQSLKNWLLKNA